MIPFYEAQKHIKLIYSEMSQNLSYMWGGVGD